MKNKNLFIDVRSKKFILQAIFVLVCFFNVSIGIAKAADYSTNIIPDMTSATTPSGVVTASSENPSFPAWYAFSNNAGAWLASSNSMPQWLGYQFTDGVKRVAKYAIESNGNAANMAPKTWEFQGSTNGADWTTIDSRSNVSFSNFQLQEFEVVSPGEYDFYRLYVTEPLNPMPSIAFMDLEMYIDNSYTGSSVVAPTISTSTYFSYQDFAVIYADIIDTGGENPSGTVYWGTSSGDYSNSCELGIDLTVGQYACRMEGLTSDIYYVQAFATNSGGTTPGGEIVVTTAVNLAVTTDAVSDLTSTSVTLNANLLHAAALETEASRFISLGTSSSEMNLGSCNVGSGPVGTYSCNKTGLTPNTTYYAVASVRSQDGAASADGDVISFTTPAISAPTLITEPVSIITSTAAVGNGNITNTGGENPTREVRWGTISNTYTDSCTAGTGSTGAYSCNITGLSPDTTYYVQAYATNSAGTTYGNEVSMTTPMSALQIAKVAAHDALNSASGTYAESDYTPANWLILTIAKADGDIAIDAAGDLGEVETAKNNAIDAMAGVSRIAIVYSANIIPAMTDYAAPSGVALASSEAFPTTAWGAFDGSPNSYVWRSNGMIMPEWIGYQFTDGAKTVAKYGIVGSDVPGLADIKAWEFQGSNDGSNWTMVDSQSGVNFAANESKEFVVANPNSYLYYRLYITSASMWACLNELEMFTEVIPIVAPTVSTLPVSIVTKNSATLNADLTNTGGENPTRYIQWGTSTGVYTVGFCNVGASSTGTYSCDITGLSPDTTYYVQAYATNSAGTTYGNEVSMTTSVDALAAAKMSAHDTLTSALAIYTETNYTPANWIVLTTAKADGDIAIDAAGDLGEVETAKNNAIDAMAGVSRIAIVYSANIIPAMTDNTTPSGVASDSTDSSSSWKAFDRNIYSGNGFGVGSPPPQWLQYQFADGTKKVAKYGIANFGIAFFGPKTWDFLGSNDGINWTTLDSQIDVILADEENREFVIMSPGDYTYYRLNVLANGGAFGIMGFPELFMYTELAPAISAPTLTTNEATIITPTTAICNANITDTGGENPVRSIRWGTASGDYSTGSCNVGTGSTGPYSCEAISLSSNTTYYIQAYATNSAGSTYGNEVTLITSMADLDVAKMSAHDTLTTTLATYTETNYTPANWIILTTAKVDGDIAINAAGDLGEVETAKNNAIDAMAGVETIAETLATAKVTAHDTLTTTLATYTETKYTPANWIILTTAKVDGDITIDAAGDLGEVETAKNNAVDAMAGVETIVIDDKNDVLVTPKIKKISDETETSLKVFIEIGKENKNKKVDVKIKIENLDENKDETLTYEGRETDSDGELSVTIENLKAETKYRFKIKYSLKNEDNFSDWSDSEDGVTSKSLDKQMAVNENVDIAEAASGIIDGGQDILKNIQDNMTQTEKELDAFSNSLKKTEVKKEDTQKKKSMLVDAKSFFQPLTSDIGVVATGIVAVSGITAFLVATPAAVSVVSTTSLGSLFRASGVFLGGMIGIKRKRKKWGVVFDSKTKIPLALAVVSIFSKDNRILNKTITDKNGRFGFLVKAGEYYIEVTKDKFVFPSKNSEEEDLYDSVYIGGIFNMVEDQVIKLNIPLDSKGIDLREISRQKIEQMFSLKGRINKYLLGSLFYVGLFLTAVTQFFAPSNFNVILLLIYVAVIFYQIFFKRNDFGRILDSETKKPIPFAVINVFKKSDTEERVKFVVTDFLGRYFDLIDDGEYVLRIKGESLDKRMINARIETVITGGALNGDIVC